MKKRKIAFLAGLLACSLAGVATASALIVSGAAATRQTGTIDQVVYLDWGGENDVTPVTNLTPDAPAYRVVSVAAPVASATATAEGLFTADLQVVNTSEIASANGIEVEIYDAPFRTDAGHVGEPGIGANQIGGKTLTILTTPITQVFTTAKTLYIKISIDETEYAKYTAETPTQELSAKLVLSFGENA